MDAAKFLVHNKILVIDNAAIHVGSELQQLEDYLWITVIDSCPLNVFILYLPSMHQN